MNTDGTRDQLGWSNELGETRNQAGSKDGTGDRARQSEQSGSGNRQQGGGTDDDEGRGYNTRKEDQDSARQREQQGDGSERQMGGEYREREAQGTERGYDEAVQRPDGASLDGDESSDR